MDDSPKPSRASQPMRLQPLPAFDDNYIWLLSDDDGGNPLVVDPGQAGPVLRAFANGGAPLGILLTHHHDDHIGGVPELLQRWPELAVIAPFDERIPGATRRVRDGDQIRLGGWDFSVIQVPGHTRSHVAFHGHGLLFSGDTLFGLGCGRLFEGSPADMLGSLDRLAALPADTLVCCGHEYTQANAAFARVVDPDNEALRRRQQDIATMRQQGTPTLPSPLADELACNPFLRIDAPAVLAQVLAHAPDVAALDAHAPDGGPDRIAAFAALRRWKDGFRA